MTKLSRWVLLLVAALSLGGVACGPGPDDPAGQAALLGDRAKRNQAFQNVQRIYHGALEAAHSDRTKPEVRAVVDATVGPLSQSYINAAGDLSYGRYVLELLSEMRDPRAIPAFTKALDFELDAGERHAQTAANAIRELEVPDGQKVALVTALEAAVNKFPGDRAGNDARPADKVVQIDLIKTLGSLGDPAAPALVRILQSENEKLDPAVTLAAAVYLGRVATPESIPALINCLFRTIAGGRVSLADFGVAGLIRVGHPAVDPLIRVMRGQDPAAIQAATTALAAQRAARGGQAESGTPQTPQSVARDRGMRALAALGAPEAYPLIAEGARAGEIEPRVDATLMLMQLPLQGAQLAEMRTIVAATLAAATGDEHSNARSAIVSIALQTFDASFLPATLAFVQNRDEYATVRVSAVTTYAMLANKAEAAQLRALIDAEPPLNRGGGQEAFKRIADPLLAAATACDQDLACWRGKLTDSNPDVIRKAEVMLGRFGMGDAASITALLPMLDHARPDVRVPALYALDHLVTTPNQAVIDKLQTASERDDEVSRSLQSETLRILSRIRNRGAH